MVGIFLGGAAIILSGMVVHFVYDGRLNPFYLLILIAIALSVLLFPEIQYFKVKAGPFEWAMEKPQYYQYMQIEKNVKGNN